MIAERRVEVGVTPEGDKKLSELAAVRAFLAGIGAAAGALVGVAVGIP